MMNKMMLKHIAAHMCAAILPVCLLCMLAACGKTETPASAPPDAPTKGDPGAAFAEPGGAAAPAVWETVRFGQEAPAPEGCYIYQPRPENGINILYADYASGQLVYMCNRPECTHDNESCLGFRGEGQAGILAYYQEHVYTLDTNASSDHIPYIAVCDKNGENAKNLVALESGSMMMDLFAADGEAFYTLERNMNTMGEDGIGTHYLVRFGLADGIKTKVSEKDYAPALMLGGIGSEVVLYTYTFPEGGGSISGQTILGVDKNTGAERVIYEVSSGDIVGAKDGFAYVLRMEDGAIDAVNLATGEVQTTTFDKSAITVYEYVPDVTGLSPEDAARELEYQSLIYSPRGIFDGKLFVECTENRDNGIDQKAQYAIDLATGEVSRVTLTIGYEARQGSPIIIYGEVGDDFLVLHDYVNNPYPSINKDGTPYEAPLITNQYALISKADFYASNPNYQDFVFS